MNKLSASALVTVNLLDRNDNPPKFDRDKYEVKVHENERPGTVILKVGRALEGEIGSWYTLY